MRDSKQKTEEVHRFYKRTLESPYFARMLLGINHSRDNGGSSYVDTWDKEIFSFEPAWGHHHPATYSPISDPFPDEDEFYRMIGCLRMFGYTVLVPKPTHPDLSPPEVQVWWLASDKTVQHEELLMTDPDLCTDCTDEGWDLSSHHYEFPRTTDDSILAVWMNNGQ